jgi:hypothetical protein
MAKAVSGVLAAFKHEDAAVTAITGLKAKGYQDLTVYSAAPNHLVEQALDQPVSWVRLFTLIGGLTGCAAGFGMTLWMSYDWPLLVGGKPIGAIPPYVVLAFELTILFGALSTVAGVIILSALRSLKGRPFRPEFTDDTIGVFVPCPPEQRSTIRRFFQEVGSEEVTEHGA